MGKATWTPPDVFSFGQVLTAKELNDNIIGNLQFLYDQIVTVAGDDFWVCEYCGSLNEALDCRKCGAPMERS